MLPGWPNRNNKPGEEEVRGRSRKETKAPGSSWNMVFGAQEAWFAFLWKMTVSRHSWTLPFSADPVSICKISDSFTWRRSSKIFLLLVRVFHYLQGYLTVFFREWQSKQQGSMKEWSTWLLLAYWYATWQPSELQRALGNRVRHRAANLITFLGQEDCLINVK